MAEIITIQSNENAAVDIIFVGDPINQNLQDWEGTFGREDWFKEALPKQFTNTRSLYYGYHGQSSRDYPVAIIGHAAHGLLSEWTKTTTQSLARSLTDSCVDAGRHNDGPSPPVLFVCQGLGGRVVEEALLLSESEKDLHALCRKTFGIIFLGSPYASCAQRSIISLPAAPDRPTYAQLASRTRQIVGADEQSAQLAKEIRRPDWPYTCVYFCQETSTPCPGAKVLHHPCLWSMVPQSWLSDTADNHYVIPKTLPQDITKANVERSISRMSEEAARSRDDCRRYLQSEQSLLLMYLKERHATSCEWLINLQKYQKWVNKTESPLLYLQGRPGAGKSMLCSAIIKDLQERNEQGYAVAFCFFDSRQSQVSSARYILKAFAYQLRECMRPFGPECLLRSSLGEGDKLTEPISLDQFQRDLRQVFVSIEIHARIFVVLDGLDDDEGVKTVIMHEILRANRLRESPHIFRGVMSSRFACEARMNREDLVQIDLSIEPGIQHEMLNFAKFRLANIFGTSPKEKTSVLTLAKQLCSRANGAFLWLALAIEDIQRMEPRPQKSQIVDQLPSSIGGFYQRSLQQIQPQDVETAQNIFSWLTVASRPFYLSELLEALALTANYTKIHEQPPSGSPILSLPKAQTEIHRICGWLVTTTKEGIVRLRHPTLRDHLLFTAESSNRPRHPVLAAHELLARSCLVLLSSVIRLEASPSLTNTEHAQQLGRGTASTLTKYAAANWSVHYRLSETYSRNLAGTLQRCLTITLNYDCQSFSIPKSGRSIQIANTTLRISASYGLVSLTQLCLQMGADPKGGSCGLCETPLAIARACGHSEAASILLPGGTSPASRPSYNSEELIHLAISWGLTDVAQSLLEYGAKVDAVEHSSGKTLLHLAAESGRLKTVKFLMNSTANVNAVIPRTQETPLHLAAAHGYIQVVRYLVDGRDPSTRELELYASIVRQPYYQSWAEDLLTNEGGTESTVWEVEARDSAEKHIGRLRSFSARYSNIHLRDFKGRTALDLAASHGYDDVVRFLLERGADVKSDGGARCTALQAAVENGHLETVKLLLAAGANLHHQPDGLAPTLQHACKQGHDAVADFVVWHCFNAELSAKKVPWPVRCLPTKTNHTVVRDTIQKKKLHTKFAKPGTHGRFGQRLSKLTERPKD